MAVKSNKKVYIGITIITLAIISVVIVYYLTVIKPEKDIEKNIEEDGKKTEEIEVKTTENKTTNSDPSKPENSMNNDTLLKVKNPLMKGDRVQWIQAYNNKYSRAKKAAGKGSDIVILNDDGVYGNKTADAVYRLMGKKETTWTEFKKRLDYLGAQLLVPSVKLPF